LSLLLKASPLIDELALYDVVNTPGVAADLSHISTPAVGASHCFRRRTGTDIG
jgi:malate dehydrogenase